MRANKNKRGKLCRNKRTQTIVLSNGIAGDTNEKVTKTIVTGVYRKKKGRTLGDMVYEFMR